MSYKDFIIRWNNDHPLDKKYREKYNIAFNSPQHRQINQLDILLEYIEDQSFEQFKSDYHIKAVKAQQYKEGIWLEEKQLTSEESTDLFDNIDIFKFNNDSSQLQIE